MAENSVFSEIEEILCETIPKPLIYILSESGFTSKLALKTINKEHILQIEIFIETNYEKLSSGLVGSIYENRRPFKIIPGHCAFILSLPAYVNQVKNVKKTFLEKSRCPNIFSFVLRTLIEIAEKNAGRDPKGRRFDESIQHFATYLYMMSGKACYETLAANLPIPQSNTICKSSVAFNIFFQNDYQHYYFPT